LKGENSFMKTQAVVWVVVCGLVVGMAGCSKKTETLEELQQPMSPEDLNRIKNQTSSTSEVLTPAGAVSDTTLNTAGSAVTTAGDAAVEPLPPAGPYKPAAKDIQAALKSAGYYNGTVDGKIGPKTKKAIEDFQQANGLAADGKVGPKTWSLLSKHLTGTTVDTSAAPVVGAAE
jgi:murein L,D-transpeptidase YcbB/YkuD